MKKLFAIILILCLLPIAALACEDTIPLPKIETGSAETLNGCAWFAVDTTRHIVGKWNAEAHEETFSATGEAAPFILGILDNGIVRSKGELKYTEAGGLILGLTRLDVSVQIYSEYYELVSTIVEARVGGELSAAAVIAASQWRTSGTIYHVFFVSDSPKAAVGTVWLNGGKNAATLYAGEFQGVLCLGFMAGGMPCQAPEETEEPEPETTPEPAATPEPVVIRETVYYKETVVREIVQKPTCVKVIQNNFQTIINSTVKNVQTVNLGSGGGCGKSLNCVKD